MGYRARVALCGLIAACQNGNGSERPEGDATGGVGGAGRPGGTSGSSTTAGRSGGGGEFINMSGGSSTAGHAGTGPRSEGGRAGTSSMAGSGGSALSGGGFNPEGVAGSGGSSGEGGSGGSSGEGGSGGNSGEGGTSSEPGAGSPAVGLSWPIDCIPGKTCLGLGYPDTDRDGNAHDCGPPGYAAHEGTDIQISAEAQAAGTAVRAAADGVVIFAFDGKYDQCPNESEPDCRNVEATGPGSTIGTTVCTPLGSYCGTGEPGCYWCFAGGNVVVLRHEGVPGVFATRYDHLAKNSILVAPGDHVSRGQKIAEAASAGNSTGPHLHFEVWGSGFYEVVDPWAGACGPNFGPSLWAHAPPWSGFDEL